MVNYVGSGKKLTAVGVTAAASFLKCRPAAVRAVMEVETSGSGFDSMGHVSFLFEPHRFYAEIKSNKTLLNEAVRTGLAYPSWKGPGSYPKTPQLRWEQFQRACDLDETAAIRSASWGLGQIMGSEYDEAGYSSPEEMVEAFTRSEDEQIMGMARLCKARNLDIQMRKFPDITACRNFALRYNGKGYEKNKYHTKLQSAYNRWVAREQTPAPIVADDGILRVGSTGDRVKALQRTLKDKGYTIVGLVDGKFGKDTRDAVNAWKADSGRSLDGQMDQEDLLDLDNSPKRAPDPERVETTADDLKDNSSIVRDTSTSKQIAGYVGGAVLTSAGADQSGLLDKAQDAADKAERVHGLWGTVKEFLGDTGIADLLQFLSDYKFPILLAAFGILVVYMIKIQKARVEMHQNREVA